uniref:Uncharacterized protein n=1 Tax=Micrurus carvalhoi TaxID=3147026 RepID=A0A2H6N2T2_9SAUR
MTLSWSCPPSHMTLKPCPASHVTKSHAASHGRYGGIRGPYQVKGVRTCCLKAVVRSGPHDVSCRSGCRDSQVLGLRLMLRNARSVVNKAPLLQELIWGGGTNVSVAQMADFSGSRNSADTPIAGRSPGT